MSSLTTLRWTTLTVMLASSAALGAQAGSQQIIASIPLATLVGAIKDSSGAPVANAEIWLRGSDVFTHTNDLGGFKMPPVPPGDVKVSVRRLGFEPAVIDIKLRGGQIDSLVLTMTASAAALPGVVVEGEAESRSKRLLAGFWERRARGFGHFVTHDEIVRKEPRDFTDIVRSLPGVNIVEKGGRRTIRLQRGTGLRDCPPQYWVDGMRAENASPDEFAAIDIEAVEVYSGPATMPPQFAPKPTSYTCGTIVIWTRLPGT